MLRKVTLVTDAVRAGQLTRIALASVRKMKASIAPLLEVEVGVEIGGGGAEISVEDNGCGIPQHHLTSMFVHGFTTRRESHGFGLHHSASLAEEMGGSLRVESDGLGHGSTFTLRFPANGPIYREALINAASPIAEFAESPRAGRLSGR